MIYELGNQKIKIPDQDIERSIAVLGITRDEAVQTWLEDEGYLVNEEQEELEKRAKENKIMTTIHQATSQSKKTSQARTRTKKKNPEKEMIINEIAKIVPNFGEDMVIQNPGKVITFRIGEQYYKLDLTATRGSKT